MDGWTIEQKTKHVKIEADINGNNNNDDDDGNDNDCIDDNDISDDKDNACIVRPVVDRKASKR